MKILLMLILLPALGSTAQEKIKLSVDDAVQLGFKNSKTLHMSLMKVRASDAKVGETNAAMLPKLNFNGSYTRLSNIDPFAISIPGMGSFVVSPSILNNYNMRLSLQQPLFTGFRLSNTTKLAEYTNMAVTEEYNRDKEDLAYNIKNAYWSLYKSLQMKKVIDENVQQISAHLKDANNLMEQGLLTRNDVLKLEVQLSNVRYSQVDVNNGVRLARIALNNAMGIALNTDVEIQADTNYVPYTPENIEVLLEKAFSSRPDIKSANYRIKAGESGVKVAQSTWYPQIYVFGDYLYNRPNQRVVPAKDIFKDTWDVGVTVSFDIWNWGTTIHQTQQAQAQLDQARDALGVISDAIALEVTQNYLQVGQSKEKIDIAKLSVQQADENMRVTEDKFKNGLAASSEMVDAEVALLQAQTNYTNSVVDYELAKARLEKSVGNQNLINKEGGQ